MGVEPGPDTVAAAMEQGEADVGDVVSRVRERMFGSDRARTLGRYELRNVIGRGGLGVVHEAYDPQLDRTLAIKVLSPVAGAAADERQLRMLREAQALARLSHPNVVAVYDSGTSDDGVFVAMERIVGSTLSQWLAASTRSAAEILALMGQVGAGLVAAHRVGIVHRDVKPSNILIDTEGRARVVDFGLARAAGSTDAARTGGVLDLELTATGACVGTPAYMAPEQFRGDHVDARTDQWAFCLTLWEALTGSRPFSGNTFEALQEQVSRGPPPREAPAGIAPQAWEAVRRGLAPEPSERLPDLAAVLRELRPRSSRRGWFIGVATAAVAAAAATWAVSTAGSGEGGRVTVQEFRAQWTTPNQIRWAWRPLGVPDELAEYRLVTGPTPQDVVQRSPASTTWTSAELPELGHFLRPLTRDREPITAVTTVGHDPDALVHAQLIAIDTGGRWSLSSVAAGRSTPAPAEALTLFRDAEPPGYAIPKEFVVSGEDPFGGSQHLIYTARCEREPCWANLRRQAVGRRLDAISAGVYATTAFFEAQVAVDGSGPAWWSAVRLWYGSADEERIGYFDGFALPADGEYHTVQVPLRALVLQGEPVPYEVAAEGLYEWGIGGSWRRDAVVRIDDVTIRW